MAVSEDDVLHVAALARLGVREAHLPSLVNELNGILAHMEVLQRVDAGGGMWDMGGTGLPTPMRADGEGLPLLLAVPRDAFAPEMRDGFFVVPRLATHEDPGERSP